MIERRKADFPLWLFWGQEHMSWLRFLTPLSACLVHGDVRLITRTPAVRGSPAWIEKQDFRLPARGPNMWPAVRKLPIQIIELKDIAPDIAKMRASDVHTCDLLSWHLLAEYGGATADMDVIFFDCPPPTTHDVMIPIHRIGLGKPYTPIGYLQGRPCQQWKDILAAALAAYDPEQYQCCGALCVDMSLAGRLPPTIVYPFANTTEQRMHRWLFGATNFPPIPDECCGVHWYAGGNQNWNQKITRYEDVPRGAVRWATNQAIAMAEANGWTTRL